MKKALITGITGQDGAYLSKFLLNKGYEVVGLSRQKAPDTSKLEYVGVKDKVTIHQSNFMDLNETKKMIAKIAPDEIYNLAGQSSVSYSFAHPTETISDNILSTLNIVESVRTVNKDIKFYEAISSEIYGLKNQLPINEDSRIDPSTPYGVSKAADYLIVKNYRETYGLFCVSGILFNHESYLRESHFFIRTLIRTAYNISKGKDEYVYLGDGENKRDFGYSPKYVEAMWLMLQQSEPVDYIISSGTSLSIKDITQYVLKKFNVPLDRIKFDPTLVRTPNISDLYGDNTRARKDLGWDYDMNFFEVLDILIEEELKNRNPHENQ